MPPFIVTLGTLSIIGALNIFYSQSETIRHAGHRGQGAVPADRWACRSTIGGARIILRHASCCCCVAAVVWYMLNRTAYGRHVYATGDDPEAARLAGIDTDRILLSVYVLAGPDLRRSPAGR